MTILKPSQLKENIGRTLDRALHSPQYVERKGTLLVITKAELEPVRSDPLLSRWELRAETIESFYDSTKAW